ncbi:hypothetical protein ACFSL4_23770 [Streptomyces caeni]|uniref:Epimerase n=1 Tax=Streptomyces caeni TaxID=2307231 RepID=A0ABW4IXX3_9ACTN
MRIVLFGATGMPGSRIAAAVGSTGAPPRNPVAGGAGSPEAVPGEGLCEQPGFPAAYRATAPAPDRTHVSPAAGIGPGEATGAFRADGDRLPTDADGTGRISAEDHAAAFVDELERGTRARVRMPVAH